MAEPRRRGEGVPEPRRQDPNGWQMKCSGIEARIAQLFNCHLLSDVVVHVDEDRMPAHRFVLGAASPVLYKQLYEDQESNDQKSNAMEGLDFGEKVGFRRPPPVPLIIADYSAEDFFELLRFVYTDTVRVSLDNVLALLFMADAYKIGRLSEHCIESLKAEIVPSNALKVLSILRTLMLKVIISTWRETVLKSQQVHKFRMMSGVERRALLEAVAMDTDGSSTTSRNRRSAAGSARGARTGSARSSRLLGDGESTATGERDNANSDAESIAASEVSAAASQLEMGTRAGKAFNRMLQQEGTVATGFKGSMLHGVKVARLVEELRWRCWKCIQEDTGPVVGGDDLLKQDISMLREILRLENCSVPEIDLFHAAKRWGEHQCKTQGLPSTNLHIRKVLGEASLLLIRFPCMTPEEFKWEVVPTGILEYEDVHQLLYASRGLVGKFETKPRWNKAAQLEQEGGFSAKQKGSVLVSMCVDQEGTAKNMDHGGIANISERTKFYAPVKSDPLDNALKGELLRQFYGRSTTVSGIHIETSAGALASAMASMVGEDRLPPVAESYGQGSLSRASTRPSTASSMSRKAGSRPRTPQLDQPPPSLVLGGDIVENKVPGKGESRGGGHCSVDDFVRLTSGLYLFRQQKLVEFWFEQGYIMSFEHDRRGLEPLKLEELKRAERGEESVRQLLGLPELPPTGRGAPLVSFLCRH
mmetsp:Transcript_127457/g.285054  ORF Transcript_127457/g.285054 Transcript_127457/m.285054 type:complete len:702 (+) Transcript_127457:31-2136(+)